MDLKSYILEYVSSGRGKVDPKALIDKIEMDMPITELFKLLQNLEVTGAIKHFTISELGESMTTVKLSKKSKDLGVIGWCESDDRIKEGAYIYIPDSKTLYALFHYYLDRKPQDFRLTKVTKYKQFKFVDEEVSDKDKLEELKDIIRECI